MNELKVFEQREVLGKEFKMYGTPESPLFLAKDIAEWIDYAKTGNGAYDVSKMLSTVDEDEITIRKVFVSGQNRNMKMLTEDGLYEVLMQSNKPIAKQFKKEVKAILKQIRLTGGYIPVAQEESDEEFLARALMVAQRTLAKKDELLKQKEELLLEQKPKVDYYETVLQSDKLSTTTMIAKDLGMTAAKLNSRLHDLGIIYKQSNTWFLYSNYQHLIPECADYHVSQYGQTLKWTEQGRKFIMEQLGIF